VESAVTITPHRFGASYVYQVPLGRHGKYLNIIPVAMEVIDGWQFSGMTEFQGGLPMQVVKSFTAWGPNAQRPNLVRMRMPRGRMATGRTTGMWH
jgi:hypothetical protein